jgi:hypothetical protein
VVVVGVFGDIELAGSVRAAQVLLGPLTILLAASSIYLQPLMVVRHTNGHDIVPQARAQSSLVAAVTVAWTLCLLLVPDSVGTRVFGYTWFGATSELLRVGAVYLFVALSVGAINVLRCTGRVGASLRAHGVLAVSVAVGTTIGSLAAGSSGALTGFMTCSAIGPVILWRYALRRRHA